MATRFQRHVLRQVSLNSLAARVLCLAFFAWTTVYNPLHLLLEEHSDGSVSEACPTHQVAFSAGDMDHGHGNHQIHSALDHKIRAACQSQISVETSPVLPSVVDVLEAPSPRFVGLFLMERVNPPGFDVPALLPRAPPLA